ncbi:MAG: ROK family protein [Thermoleophilaceae bacterium]
MADSQPKVVGVDVGGTKVAVAPVEGAEAFAPVERPTDLTSPVALLAGIEACVREVVQRSGMPDAIGVGVPSQIDYASGRVLSSVNIPLEGVALREELGRRFGVPVYVDNDANCAALAEAQLVDNAPAHELVMLTLGTGVGGGVVIDGQIFRGATGLGAELGHVVVESNGPHCPGACPNRGCLEALCSGTALERDATETGRDRPETVLGAAFASKQRVTGHEAVTAAEGGDPEAKELLDRLGRYLGIGIAGLINTFEPEHIVIGGGLSRAAHLFLDTARAEAHRRALPVLAERVEIGLARGGANAGVIGAGVLALQESARKGDTAGDAPARATSS